MLAAPSTISAEMKKVQAPKDINEGWFWSSLFLWFSLGPLKLHGPQPHIPAVHFLERL